MKGYFVLGGGKQPSALPGFDLTISGNHIGSRDRGQWCIDTELRLSTLNIPSRDKQVQVWANDNGEFERDIGVVDSWLDDAPYRLKLSRIRERLPDDFVGAVNNVNTDTHGSLALVSNQGFHLYGLLDTQSQSCYMVWTLDPSFIGRVLNSSPLRFLLYRLPVANVVFIPSEALCSKWWRWLKTSTSLQAFNALERRICGS